MNKALYEKLFSEQEKYRAWLLEQPPAEILSHAYEYTVREDIILTLEYHDVDDEQARVLLAQENLLGELFDAFEHRETNYMDVVSGTVYDLANTLLSEEEREKNKLRDLPIYYHSGEYARENGELDKYRESRAANIGCRDAIQDAIKNHYHDNRLDPAAVSEVVDKYNFHRVLYVLANTVRQKDWDGRFSQSNKDWAATMYIPEDKDGFNGDRNTAFCVEAHPTLVNGYIDMARDQFLLTQPLTRKDIQAEADRINSFFEKNGEPNSPNKTHIMIEISPKFLRRAGTKDIEALEGSLSCFETLSFSTLKDRKGIFAMISKDQSREWPYGVKKPSALNKLKQPAKPGPKVERKGSEPER